jgi:hypothetical protein
MALKGLDIKNLFTYKIKSGQGNVTTSIMDFNFCTYIESQNPKVNPTLALNFFIPKLHIPTHHEHT